MQCFCAQRLQGGVCAGCWTNRLHAAGLRTLAGQTQVLFHCCDMKDVGIHVLLPAPSGICAVGLDVCVVGVLVLCVVSV